MMGEATFTFQVDEALKAEFTRAAKADDRTGAQLLRDFMRDYVRKREEGAAYDSWFIAEVEKGSVPPRNPFLRGKPLHYYWLPHLVTAAEYRMASRGTTLEQVLLVNSVALGLAFILFLYGFVRHWVDSAGASAAAVCAALVFTSFEGLERLIVVWRTGAPFDIAFHEAGVRSFSS